MDFETARFNMIEQQIRPWSVLDQDVLDALAAIKREDFVPPAYREMAFSDVEIPLQIGTERSGEFMLSPKVEARLLQALAPRKHEQVLEIGAGSGFMAALLAYRARAVISLEINPTLASFASDNLRNAGFIAASIEQADGANPANLPGSQWDVIILSGSVPYLASEWLDRLKLGGRLAVIVGQEPVMKAQLITRLGERAFDTKTLFETVVSPLHGFPRKSEFVF
jgi:protein-L-isoaspartate(D-aspartate) O-methyltransferase